MPDLFRAVGMTAWAVRSALACVLRPRIWVPFLLIAGLQVAVLTGLVHFHQEPLDTLAVPLVQSVAGDRGTHYPTFYLALPAVYSRTLLVVSVLGTSLLLGVATLLFAQAFGAAVSPRPWQASWRKYPLLIGVTGLLAALLFGVSLARGLVPDSAFLGNPMVRWVTRGVILGLSVLVQSLLVYAAAWVVLRGSGLLAAVLGSVRLTASTLLPTLFLVGFPALVIFPLNYLGSRGDLLVGKFRPEAMVAILSVQIGLEFVMGFVLVGAITRVFLYQTEAAR